MTRGCYRIGKNGEKRSRTPLRNQLNKKGQKLGPADVSGGPNDSGQNLGYEDTLEGGPKTSKKWGGRNPASIKKVPPNLRGKSAAE